MVVLTGVISYPIPAYQNLPIESDSYQPSRFVITAITLGLTTTVTTSVDHNYVIGQLVRLLIPVPFGSVQLNNKEGIVVSIPSSTQVVLNISSYNVDAFVATPYSATITGATKANPCVLTVDDRVYGLNVTISGVGGMTELNGNTYRIISQTSTTITIDVNSLSFTTYTAGGTANVFPQNGSVAQILAVGDFNAGQINSNGISSTLSYIPGSFINISPQ